MSWINSNGWNKVRYTVIAPAYDFVARFDQQRQRSFELLALRRGERVLIVGGGTGADIPFIAAGVEIIAGDVTVAMVERMITRAGREERAISAAVMDGQRLPLSSGSVDAVVLHLIVAVIPDPVALLREVSRVLKPCGRAVILDKFVAEGSIASAGRRALNVVTSLLFTSITRTLGPLLQGTGLTVTHREPAAFGGRFEIVSLTRSA